MYFLVISRTVVIRVKEASKPSLRVIHYQDELACYQKAFQ